MDKRKMREALNALEIEKCRVDPGYFLSKHCQIRHPMKGKIRFHLFEYQKVALKDYMANRKNIVLKSRQMGFSWLAAGYSLWKAMFQKESDILFMSKKESDAKEILHKVKYIHNHLPMYLKISSLRDSASTLALKNGSRIVSLPATEDSGRGFAGSLVIIDEAAFIPWGEKIFGALRPTLSTGGSIILQSTAPDHGGENLFARIFHDYKENGFHRVIGPGEESIKKQMVHWTDNPERDDKWYEEERPGYTDKQWATEMEGDFSQSTRPVFPREILKLHMPEEGPQLTWQEGRFGERFCKRPMPGEKYAIGVDVAEGLEKGDFTVAQVLRKSDGMQVAVWRSKIPVMDATEKIIELAKYYNDAVLAIEDNGLGVAALQVAKKKYRRLFRRKVKDQKTDRWTEKLGWRTTKRSKPLAIGELELALRDNKVLLTHKTTQRELWQYEYDDKGNTNAPSGRYYDDCVMSLAIAYQALQQVRKPISLEEELFKKQRRKRKLMKRMRNKSLGY